MGKKLKQMEVVVHALTRKFLGLEKEIEEMKNKDGTFEWFKGFAHEGKGRLHLIKTSNLKADPVLKKQKKVLN